MRIRPVQVGAVVAILGAIVLGPYTASAEFPHAPATASSGVLTRDKSNKASAPTLVAAQLDQLLAPIDLYSDALLSQIFLAATHPQDVVGAARWLEDPEHAQLKGEVLTKAVQSLPWDPSVKALASVPRVLMMMSEHVDWMRRLADVYIAQRAELMEAVQRLRRRARAAGTLDWGSQQTVSVTGQTIAIQNSDTAYVPEYNPTTAYGVWPYPAFPPYLLSVSGATIRKTQGTAHSELRLPATTEVEDFRRLPTGELVPALSPTGSAGSSLLQTTTSEDFHRLPTGELAGKHENPRSSTHVTPQGRVAHVVAPSSAPAAPRVVNPPPITHATAPPPRAQMAPHADRSSRRHP